MKERPILYTGEMVRAILDDRKSMTRRVMKPQPVYAQAEYRNGEPPAESCYTWPAYNPQHRFLNEIAKECPYGYIGDRFWVRETWVQLPNNTILYRATDEERQEAWTMYGKPKWKPSIFMPRSASRITLEITNVKVERLRDITEEDAIKEGVKIGSSSMGHIFTAREHFEGLWDFINGKKYPWSSNPFVWVIEFKRI
jgi:hypothetical protein